LNRARAALIPLVLGLFLTSVAQGAETAADPAAGTAVPAGGALAVSRCPEPKMAKLPGKRKVGSTVVVRASGVTVGTQWLLRIDGRDWAAGNADSDRIRYEGKLVDFGLRARKMDVELVLANEACENSPWKLTRKVGYAGRFNGALTDPNAPKPQQTQRPASQDPTPQATATPDPTPTGGQSPKVVVPKPVKPVKIQPLEAPTNGRVWVTPTDVTAHSNDKPKNPKLPRAEFEVDDAQSTNALVGLGILFVVIATATGVGLILLNKKDQAMDSALEEGRLPSHLDTTDLGNLGLSEAGEAVVKKGAVPSLLAADAIAPVLAEEAPEPGTSVADGTAAEEDIPGHVEPDHIASEPGDVPVPVAGAEHSHMPGPPPVESVGDENINSFLEERAPTPAEVPSTAEPHPTAESAEALAAAAAAADLDNAADEQVPAPDQNGSQDQFDQVVTEMLDDSTVQQELRGIVAEAREEALRQGVPVDRDGILSELERVTASAHLSGPAREKLMQRFEQIVSEELDRVPQAH
jgi:hypothetical protein